jgi:2-methylcitrate dehydratase PrpD
MAHDDRAPAANAPSISRCLAELAATTTFAGLPAAVVAQAKLLMLDAIGNAFASTAFPFAADAAAAVRALARGDVPVIGLDVRASARDAALLDGVLVHGLDFDDTHLSGVVHVSASALPAALAVAAARHLPGHELLTGYVLGVEVASRIGAAAGGGFHRAGFHPTGVAGAFASAVIAGRLGGLDAAQIDAAQGVALSFASGSMQFAEEGAATKRLHGGWAAACGITAAELARAGVSAPAFAYEGGAGLFRTHVPQGDVDLALLTKDLGSRWQLDDVAVKLFPACHFTHACLEAAIDIAGSEDLHPDDVQSVTCLVHEDYVPVVCEPRDRKIAPSSDYEAKFALQYLVAAALVHRRLTLAELDDAVRTDAQVLALARRVNYALDPDSGYPDVYSGEVAVRTTDGRDISRRVFVNRGAPERPVTEQDVLEKFHANLAFAGVDDDRAARIADAVLHVERCDDAATLAELLAG